MSDTTTTKPEALDAATEATLAHEVGVKIAGTFGPSKSTLDRAKWVFDYKKKGVSDAAIADATTAARVADYAASSGESVETVAEKAKALKLTVSKASINAYGSAYSFALDLGITPNRMTAALVESIFKAKSTGGTAAMLKGVAASTVEVEKDDRVDYATRAIMGGLVNIRKEAKASPRNAGGVDTTEADVDTDGVPFASEVRPSTDVVVETIRRIAAFEWNDDDRAIIAAAFVEAVDTLGIKEFTL